MPLILCAREKAIERGRDGKAVFSERGDSSLQITTQCSMDACVCVCMNEQTGTETDADAKKGKQEHGHICQVVTLVLVSRSVF